MDGPGEMRQRYKQDLLSRGEQLAYGGGAGLWDQGQVVLEISLLEPPANACPVLDAVKGSVISAPPSTFQECLSIFCLRLENEL